MTRMKRCVDAQGQRRLRLAMANMLGRDEARQFSAHIDDCAECRDAIIDHANSSAVAVVSFQAGISEGDLQQALSGAEEELQLLAASHGISLREALEQYLNRAARRGH